MAIHQLELWESIDTEERSLWIELAYVQNQHNNLRKGFFSRYEMMKSEITSLKEEVMNLKKLVEGKNSTQFFEIEFLKQAK